MKASTRGRSEAVPDQMLTFSAAVAVDCPNGPVKYSCTPKDTLSYRQIRRTQNSEKLSMDLAGIGVSSHVKHKDVIRSLWVWSVCLTPGRDTSSKLWLQLISLTSP
ncbi:hypothetical protein HanPI659440_Chr02g0039241 [Helianthus annuus]|nr:hypothetical protein HanPI659440_Chr02g0039241 [Helianthus annuus]